MWALVAVFGLLLAVQAVLFPTYRSPDEPAHVDMTRAVRAEWRWPDPGERRLSVEVTNSWGLVAYRPWDPGLPFDRRLAPPRGERLTFADLGPDRPSDIPQQMTQHPPLYYLGGAVVLAAADALPFTMAYDVEVLLLRFYSAVLVLPLPVLAWATAWRATGDRAAALVAATLPLAVPMLTHIGSSVNNDNLLVVLVAAMTALLAGVAKGDLSARTAVAVGVLGALALLTKGFALALPPVVAAAYLLGARRPLLSRFWVRQVPAGGTERHPERMGRGWGLLGRRGGAALGVMLAGGLWWWVANLVRHGSLQPLPFVERGVPEGFTPDLAWWAPFALERFASRFWFEPVTVPGGSTTPGVVASLVLLALVGAAFAVVRTGATRADLAVLCLPFLGIFAVVAYGALDLYLDTGAPRGIHGRYTYPGLAGVAAVAAAGVVSLLGRHRRWAPLAVLGVAGALQLQAGVWTLDRWWGSTETGLADSTRALLAWSPLASPALVALVVLLAAASAFAALALWVERRRLA